MKAPAMTRDNPVKPSETWAWGLEDIDAIWTVNCPEDGGNVVCLPPPEAATASFARWPERARLIAAAPELLEAAQAYLRWCEKSLGAGPVGNPRTHLWHNEQIRAAILKATGAPR